ncbi:MAG: DNA polymerase III subunit alpha [Candidatus Pedobacter colombiensis]|uniref:DNA-directed DNA polymerase n=1 Tax=Candidatus Pedobacter colombiensis TaxID=3121371 RepID=A0AAJ5W4J2_9SPHI|nr:DNA polymerase III subunit alpha [Pedobacter sp.]WEK17934.1 MAG: DNA polymerase III subunit alpha [Pedobacter sp.]
MLVNVHSYFSLRYGTLSIDEVITGLIQRGYDTAVLTDINNSTGALQYIKACQKEGINGLAGMEFRNGDELLYIGIARNTTGFMELNELVTEANRYKSNYPVKAPACKHVYFIYPFNKNDKDRKLAVNEFIGIRHIHLNQIRLLPSSVQQKLVMWQPVTFTGRDKYELHRQLRAISHNILISQLTEKQYADMMEVFPSKAQLLERFRDFPQIIANTERLLGNCSFDFDFSLHRNKKTFTGNHADDRILLRKYALEGFQRRYGKADKVAEIRVLKELEIIDNLKFSSYFLITDDICRYARSRGFHYVGRGSGANSIVAYCLQITDVCPIELDLYFERFLNPKRQSPPDFDIDFSWKERDEMYDYIFKRYRTSHTALMGAMSTFRDRSILREMGKIYGLPKAEIDRLIHDPHSMLNKNEVVSMILSVYDQMADFPNQRTIHASGVIISEEPITSYCALDYPPKGLPTMQFDMHIAEDIGYEKFDILSQRGLGHIKDCVEIIKENTGEVVDIHQPRKFFVDEKINTQLRSSNTIGCFYIESPAMRQLIAKLDCKDYLTLVAASSIIRPGVASSGMMKAYIERHHAPDKVEYIHPVFKEQLEETYGVMVYQEDVMKIGHAFGGLDLADADVLRRMMSGKGRSAKHLAEIEDKFFHHCSDMNYPEHITREVWRQMESFAGYSFNKAHSASFAVESYQSLYLKTYFPMEFMVSVLNNYGGFYSRKVYVNEAKKTGANVNLPCVNNSSYLASITGKEIFLGFDVMQNLESQYAQLIPHEREMNGPYTSMSNFVLRTGISLDQLIILIRVGALRFTGSCKKELLWEAHLMLSHTNRKRVDTDMFAFQEVSKPLLPKFDTQLVEHIYDELELIGFAVSASMFDMVRTDFRGDVIACDLKAYEGQVIRLVGDYVCEKYVRTKNGKVMKFGTFFDVNGDFFDTVHFPPSLAAYPLNGSGVYLILGKVVLDFGYPAIEVQKLAKLVVKPDPRSV